MNSDDRLIRWNGLAALATIIVSSGAFAGVAAVPFSPENAKTQVEAKTGPDDGAAAPLAQGPTSAQELPSHQQEPSNQQEPSSNQTTKADGNPILGISLKDLPATRERPVFSPSRRPPAVAAPQVYVPEPPPVEKPADPERPSLSLIGTVKGGEHQIGIFLSQTNNEIIRLHIGEESAGWKLLSINRRQSILEKDKQAITLEIPAPGTAAPDAAPPGVPGMGVNMPPPVQRPPPAPPPSQMPGTQRFRGRHSG
ncbi:hypothetical protein [Methylocapsa palsarum]|uniref:General secretion pathway protein N n=1 Tax=Methylocapsa palsarum TaxID=1612308 RepID=A0A1I3WVY1_9HYPH|nr:hypothetical protein [Methylocapsa palsarum]SFK11319.1 hypothetical protein SAMN05444581_102168 [Methylocapsa palsarum]